VEIQVLVENLGDANGTEVTQVYVGDVLASVVRYARQLAAFKRVEFEANESKKVILEINVQELAFYDVNMKWGVEPGQFKVEKVIFLGNA
jgi:beta-glucosidase